MGHDTVEEVAVVRDDDHRPFVTFELLLEPGDGVDIEVVGRLVEEEDVGLGEQYLRQQHLELVGAGQ